MCPNAPRWPLAAEEGSANPPVRGARRPPPQVTFLWKGLQMEHNRILTAGHGAPAPVAHSGETILENGQT